MVANETEIAIRRFGERVNSNIQIGLGPAHSDLDCVFVCLFAKTKRKKWTFQNVENMNSKQTTHYVIQSFRSKVC